MLSSAGMTSRLDRLERRGLVRRLRDPDDRRGVLVELTDAGRKIVDQAVTANTDRESELLAGIGVRELEVLSGLLQKALAHVERASGDRLTLPAGSAPTDRSDWRLGCQAVASPGGAVPGVPFKDDDRGNQAARRTCSRRTPSRRSRRRTGLTSKTRVGSRCQSMRCSSPWSGRVSSCVGRSARSQCGQMPASPRLTVPARSSAGT